MVLALIGVAGFIYLYKTTDIPDPNEEFLTNASIVYYDGGKEELGRYALQNRESISIDEMPENVKQAVVAAEDQTFYSNNGIDTKGILRAVFNNASGGSTQGASTITQQYVKILYLNQERSYKRKVKEAILSLKIQREYSKERGARGLPQHHLLRARRLRHPGRGRRLLPEAGQGPRPARVGRAGQRAQRPQRPRPRRRHATRAGRSRAATSTSWARWPRLGDITEAEAEQAKKRLPKFPKIEAESTYGGQKGHMLALVKDQLLGLMKVDGTPFTEDEIDGGGLRITTTLQPGS